MEVIRVKIVGLKIEYKSCSKKAAIYLIICIFNVQCIIYSFIMLGHLFPSVIIKIVTLSLACRCVA